MLFAYLKRIQRLARLHYADRTAHTKLGGMGMRVFGFDFEKRPMPLSSEKLADARHPLVEIASRPSAQTARCSNPISRSISVLAGRRLSRRHFGRDDRAHLRGTIAQTTCVPRRSSVCYLGAR